MKKFAVAATVVIFLAVAITFYISRPGPESEVSPAPPLIVNDAKNMKIESPAFGANANIPAKFTCDGENISPPLAIRDVPAEAKALALIMDDPDAPVAGGFVHWVLFNFNTATSEIPENSVPAGAAQGQNSAGRSSYTGPCPPSGVHRYFFKLYALDSPLDLDSQAKREDVEKAMGGHIIAKAELIGLYQRQK